MPTELDPDPFGVDLVTAYRKAKVDMFYDDSPRRMDLVIYEEALSENLRLLRERLTGADETWVLDPSFLGTFTFVPKSLKEPDRVHRSFWSAPAKTWRGHWNGEGERPDAAFRLMAVCSIDMHVFSTLWMLHVGTFLDMQLDDSARGSRIQYNTFGAVEHLKPGTFENYQSAYQRWRDDGLESMATGLNAGFDVIAMTADITAFYHRLDVRFLLDERFLGEIMGVELSEWQLKLHRLFVSAMHAWSVQVGEALDWERCGLPVGLPASAVVANLALAELDKVIDGMEPLFYGRYVDDLLLVVEDQGDTENQAAFLQHLAERSEGVLQVEFTGPNPVDVGLKFVPDYLASSLVMFENEKNKTFHLSSSSGHAVIEAIRANIQERNSEWRALAVVPSDVGDIEPSIAQARRSDGDPALTLRDADEISARKQSFSIRIRDFEGFERNLPPQAWEDERRTFFHAVREHVLSLPSVFELAAFLPRLISLGAACADSEALIPTIAILPTLPEEVRATCDIKVSDFPMSDSRREIILDRWASHLGDQAIDGLARGWMAPVTGTTIRELRTVLGDLKPRHSGILARVSALLDAHQRLAQRDLAHRPYRWGILGLDKGERVPSAPKQPGLPLHGILRDALNQFARAVPEWRGRTLKGSPIGSFDAGLAFATRPPSMMELYRALGSRERDDYGLADSQVVERILNGVRGRFGHPHTYLERRDDLPDVIHVPTGRMKSPVTIALVMMGTDVQNTIDSATGTIPSKGQRYNSIRALLESVRKGVNEGARSELHPPLAGKPDYVLLPELSMPRDWFDEFALALMRSGISLIAGIEHQPRPNKGVSNQVWAALRTNSRSDFFPHRQDKQSPAIPELPILAHTGTHWSPEFVWKRPPVIEHGGFRFALLICSEFTNINYRAQLRGNVDALFVPEWNQDLHSFEALVEASALDLHAYIAQANTRGYGDTRLRAPAKKDWGRDVVRLKGGQHDYFVVGEMDYESLRHFQSTPTVVEAYKPPTSNPLEFKPMPNGFVLDPDRIP